MTFDDILDGLGRGGFGIGIHARRRHGRREKFVHFGWPGFAAERERRGRGDLRYEILGVLADQPRHGYDVMRELAARRPEAPASPGSVYPTLQMLGDEGLVTARDDADGKRIYAITAEGRAALDARPRPAAEADDESDDGLRAERERLRNAALRLGAAVWQAARERDAEFTEKVRGILDEARREIYNLLGEHE